MKSLSFRKDLIGVQEELLRFAYKLILLSAKTQKGINIPPEAL